MLMLTWLSCAPIGWVAIHYVAPSCRCTRYVMSSDNGAIHHVGPSRGCTRYVMSSDNGVAIRAATMHDFESVLAVINDGARAYEGSIPAEAYKEPYMDAAELRGEIIDAGIQFFLAEAEGQAVAAMGIQERRVPDEDGIAAEVVLVRHAYTRTAWQRQGIGGALLSYLLGVAGGNIPGGSPPVRVPVLIGTWASNDVAIRFYEREGFRLIGDEGRKNQLLRTYWFSSSLGVQNDAESAYRKQQMAASVVLADRTWWSKVERLRGGATQGATRGARGEEWAGEAADGHAGHHGGVWAAPWRDEPTAGHHDGEVAAASLREYLERFEWLPAARTYRRQQLEFVQQGCTLDGARVLDVGWGLGYDVIRLAQAVGPMSTVAYEMIQAARQSAAARGRGAQERDA